MINGSGQFVGAAVLATGNVQAGGVFAVGLSGFFGVKRYSIIIGGCTLSFQGGILYGHSGCLTVPLCRRTFTNITFKETSCRN